MPTNTILVYLFSGVALLTSCTSNKQDTDQTKDLTNKDETKPLFSSLEDSLTSVVANFPEVIKEAHLIDSLSGGKRGITIIVTQNTEDSTLFDIRVAEDNGDALATYFLYDYNSVSKTFTTVMSIHELNPIPDIDPVLVEKSKEIVEAISKGNYKILVSAMHPTRKLRFSPYAYIDTVEHPAFTQAEFLNTLDKKHNWGSYDGSGEPIVLTGRQYMKRFVYNVDFIKLGEVNFNETKGTSTSLDNLEEVYKNCPYAEYYYSGKDESGFGWSSLRLVFKKESEKYYLIAIIHNEWTV